MLSRSIDEPFTITTLPRPLDTVNGRVFASPVYSLSHGRKRKRDEVVVGVDGEIVNVYNVRTQAIAASYAIPSHTYLAAAPCSIYSRPAKAARSWRQTHIVLRDGQQNKRLRLLSYVEEQGNPQHRQREVKAPIKYERKLRQDDVVGIDALYNRGDETQLPGALIYHKDGHINHLTGDLSQLIWEHVATDQESIEVQFATIIDVETARKGLLRSREDLLDFHNPLTSPNSHTTSLLLFQVVKVERRMCVRIFTLRDTSTDHSKVTRSPLEEIIAYELPVRVRNLDDHADYELHPSSGRLYYHSRDRLTVFNLCGAAPKVECRLGRKGESPITSFSRLSPASVFAVSPEKWVVLETKYGSSLGFKSLCNDGQEDSLPTQPTPIPPPLEICTFLQELGLLVGICGYELVALQLGEDLHKKNRRKDTPFLVDVVGKKHQRDGSLIDFVATKSRNAEKWVHWKFSVDKYIRDDDVDALERFVAGDLHLGNSETEPACNERVNGHSESQLVPWDLPSTSYDPQFVDSKKALYLLGKILAWRVVSSQPGVTDHQLEIGVKSHNIVRWLALGGYLSIANIELAVPLPSRRTGDVPHAVPGDIFQAVQQLDTGFHLMCDLLALPVHWDLAEVVQALKMLITSLDTATETDTTETLALPDGTDGDIAMLEKDVDTQFEAEAAAAAKELEYAKFVFDSGLRIRSETLRLLIARLESFPNEEIVKVIRSMLSTDEAIFLIAILRVELRDGGWTARHVADGADDVDNADTTDLGNAEQLSSSDQALRTIASLLNSCIDAIGVSGWLVGRSGDREGTEALIETVRAEISAALEGCYEAEALGRCLDDIIRLSGTEETLEKRTQPAQILLPEQAAMPLGGKQAPPTVKALQSKDGKKSRTALAEKRSRAVGKYTYEQIRF